MEFDRDAIVQRVLTTPPRCLGGFVATQGEKPEPWEGYEAIAAWKLRCRCGSSTGKFLGYPLHDFNSDYKGDAYVGPLASQCTSCNEVTEILDTRVDGYHPEVGFSSGHNRGEGERVAFSCPKCSAQLFDPLLMSFLYWDGGLDYVEDYPEDCFEIAQNFFNEFVAYGTCNSCGHSTRFTDFGKL